MQNYDGYTKLRGQLELLKDEWKALIRTGLRIFHERLSYDPALLTRTVVPSLTRGAAWSAFIGTHRGGNAGLEDWDTYPDASACSRFHGNGVGDLQAVLGLAKRGYYILLSLRKLADEGMPIPEGFRLELPEYGEDDAAYGWLETLYATGRAYRTALLRVQNRGLWGGLDATPSDPESEVLEHDLLRSSLELLTLALTPHDVVPLGEGQDQPPICLPPAPAQLTPRWDGELRELRFGSDLIKVFRTAAPNQESILAAFEEEGWPSRIDDPIPPNPDMASKKRLAETIEALNDSHKTANRIRFRGDGTGEGIIWKSL